MSYCCSSGKVQKEDSRYLFNSLSQYMCRAPHLYPLTVKGLCWCWAEDGSSTACQVYMVSLKIKNTVQVTRLLGVTGTMKFLWILFFFFSLLSVCSSSPPSLSCLGIFSVRVKSQRLTRSVRTYPNWQERRHCPPGLSSFVTHSTM